MRARWSSLGFLLVIACGSVEGGNPIDAPPGGTIDAPVDAPPGEIDAPPGAPEVVSVTVPAGVDSEGATANITLQLHGKPAEELIVAVAGTLGTYTPSSTTVTTDGAGNAMTTTAFRSGTAGGTEAGMATVRNPQGLASTKNFGFPVVALRRIGFPNQLEFQGTFTAGFLLGETITVPAAGRLKKVGWITATDTASVKIGIYTDNNGSPGTLLAQIPASDPSIGANEVAFASPILLNAGTYWFMATYSSEGGTYRDGAANRISKYITFNFSNALPSTFPSTGVMTQTNAQNFNYYLVLGQP